MNNDTQVDLFTTITPKLEVVRHDKEPSQPTPSSNIDMSFKAMKPQPTGLYDVLNGMKELFSGGLPVGEVLQDNRGKWVIVDAEPLQDGQYAISLNGKRRIQIHTNANGYYSSADFFTAEQVSELVEQYEAHQAELQKPQPKEDKPQEPQLYCGDDTKLIRECLKTELGYNAKFVTVKKRHYYALDFTIRDASVNKKHLEKWVKRFESISRCEYSGDILSGGNTFVDVSASEDVKKQWQQKYLSEVTAAFKQLRELDEGEAVDLGNYTLYRERHDYVKVYGKGTIENLSMHYDVNHSVERLAEDLYLLEQPEFTPPTKAKKATTPTPNPTF